MRGQLSVRLNDGTTDRIVTKRVRDLRFRKTAPGGFASASCTVVVPRDTFKYLGANDRLFVYDSRTSRTVWEGYTENPGAVDGADGQAFEISAMGTTVLANDRAERLPYLDQNLDGWRQDDVYPQVASSTAEASQFPEAAGAAAGTAALYVQFNPGQPITTSSQVGMIYSAFEGSPMTLGAFTAFVDCGQTDANYATEWVPNPWVTGNAYPSIAQSASGVRRTFYTGTDFATGKTSLTFRLRRSAGGATNISTDTAWAGSGTLWIAGHLMDRNGTLLTMSTASHMGGSSYILASQVAEDLLGRILTACDPVTAQIDTSVAHIDQLAYLDATTAAQVFDDMALYEPDYYWGIGASSPAGKFSFWFRAWPSTPRYVISTRDGYDAPGGEVDLCNRIAIDWTDAKGVSQTTIVTASVPELGGSPSDPGARIKDAESVSLPEGQGSAANAQLVGTAVLASKNNPGRAATATVARPIPDLLTGSMVMPWEIEPGYLVRVRETGEDLRLTETEYVDTECAATLTLGTPVATSDELIVRALQKRSA